MYLFYLANETDTMRLSTADTVEPAHACTPRYFDTPDAAYHHSEAHPQGASLHVHRCPAAETIPGAGVGAAFVAAADVYHAAGKPFSAEVYLAVAAEVHSICAKQ